jgi:nicotinate-nucleotide adenylyltransferase
VRLLVFGGSFNPVHVGHLVAAEELRAEFGYDVVLLVPSFDPPHKELVEDPGAEHRIAMLRLAAEGDATMVVDDCEMLRGGTSYTIDTLKDISGRYAVDGKPGLVLGDDLIPGFSAWKNPTAIAEAADIICAHRLSEGDLPLAFSHVYAHNSIVKISSSMVRDRIRAGLPFRRLIDPSVFRYIVEHGLYGFRRA